MELLTVIAIIAVLAALTFPLLTQAKKASHGSVTLSNLRQCGIALALYAPEAQIPVPYEHAKHALSGAPTLDQDDDSPYHRNRQWPAPFIGSYGYLRGSEPFISDESVLDLAEETYGDRPFPVMANIWQAEHKVRVLDTPLWEPWNGTPPSPLVSKCLADQTCLLPDRITYLKSDGSAKSHRLKASSQSKFNPMFLWWYVFDPPRPLPQP